MSPHVVAIVSRRVSALLARTAVLAGVLLGLVAAGRAQSTLSIPTQPNSRVKITLTSPCLETPAFGFIPVRVTIENASEHDGSWTLNFHPGSLRLPESIGVYTRQVGAAAGQTRDTWLYVPIADAGDIGVPPTLSRTGVDLPAAPSRGSAIVTNVTVTRSANQARIVQTRTMNGRHIGSEVTEIDETDGSVRRSRVLANGRSRAVGTNTPPMPKGRQVTYTINSDDGTFTRDVTPLADATAPSKVSINVLPASPNAPRPSVSPMSGPASVSRNVARLTSIEIEGPGMSDNRSSMQWLSVLSSSADMAPIAASLSIESVLSQSLRQAGIPGPNVSLVSPSELPADWRVWSPFGQVIMTDDEYSSLDLARKSALRSWVATGGQLHLVPSAVRQRSAESCGAGRIVRIAQPAAQKSELEALLNLEISLGGHVGYPGRAALQPPQNSELERASREQELRVLWIGIFLAGFAVLIGPVNLFVFAPAKKRHRLFVTTPLLSLAAVLVLGAKIVMQDGIGAEGWRRAIVVLIPDEHQAVVVQEQGSTAGFLTRSSFPLSDDTQLAVLRGEVLRPNVTAHTLMRTGSEASGTWFRSRNTQAHLLQRVVPTRARVERIGTGPAGAPIVQSSLGAPLREFVYTDEGGATWSAAELPPGGKVTLSRGGQWPLDELLLGGTPRADQFLKAAAPKFAGHWVAKTGPNELAPIETLSSVQWTDPSVVVTGRLEGAATKEARP